MFYDVVHTILKDYRETKRFFWEKPSKLKYLILLFSIFINDRTNFNKTTNGTQITSCFDPTARRIGYTVTHSLISVVSREKFTKSDVSGVSAFVGPDIRKFEENTNSLQVTSHYTLKMKPGYQLEPVIKKPLSFVTLYLNIASNFQFSKKKEKIKRPKLLI